MARLNRPKLATRYTGPRAGDRDFVSLEGRCRVGEGEIEQISILDLDARGCRVKGITAAVTKVDVVQLWLGDLGPLTARLRWAKRGSAGLAFDAPIRPEDVLRSKTLLPMERHGLDKRVLGSQGLRIDRPKSCTQSIPISGSGMRAAIHFSLPIVKPANWMKAKYTPSWPPETAPLPLAPAGAALYVVAPVAEPA